MSTTPTYLPYNAGATGNSFTVYNPTTSMTGLQLVATQGLLNGEGLGPPNITANYSSYQSFEPVSNFSNIYYTANSAVANVSIGLTAANAALLQSIGANSFPHLFGQIPNDFSDNLGTGVLFDVAPARTAQYFGVGVELDPVSTPQLIPPPGSYTTTPTVNVSIVCNTSGANVYYTLDGSTPNTNSTLYSNSIVIDSNTTIKAFATAYGYSNSNIASGTYHTSVGVREPVIEESAMQLAPRDKLRMGVTPPTFTSANIGYFTQLLSIAQDYASTAYSVISSAATAQWPGGLQATITGGFSNIAGNSPSDFQTVAIGLQQMGTLMNPSQPSLAFSNAACFQQLLLAGQDTLGNLHLTFFGQQLTDPATGQTYTINESFFSNIIANPVTPQGGTLALVALNPLDALVGNAANTALSSLADLDDIVTFFQIGPNAAPNIYDWNDCLNVSLLLGGQATQIISTQLGLSNTEPLDVYTFTSSIVQNISGLGSVDSMIQLGQAMANITPITNSSQLLALQQPVSSPGFANIQASYGPGSGQYGNPTVEDVLGATNYNDALSQVTTAIQPLTTTAEYANISSDTAKIASALSTGIPVGGVTLSNGQNYTDINELAVNGSALVNTNASSLATAAPSIPGFNSCNLNAYNQVAQTHNNSISLTDAENAAYALCPLPLKQIVGNAIQVTTTATGLIALVMSIIHKQFGIHNSHFCKFIPQPLAHWNIPGGMFGSIAGFVNGMAELVQVANAVDSLPGINKISGLSTIVGCIDTTSVAGQALNGVLIEANNMQSIPNNLKSTAANFGENAQNAMNTASSVGSNTLGGGAQSSCAGSMSNTNINNILNSIPPTPTIVNGPTYGSPTQVNDDGTDESS